MHLFWSYFLILNCRIHVAWLTGRRIEFLVAKCISSLTLGKTQKSLFKITYKPKLYFCYYWIATVFIWHIRNSSHKNVRCKCCTFLGHDEKQSATIREPEIPCNINFSERKKKTKNGGWNRLVSCGRLHKQWKLNKRTNLSACALNIEYSEEECRIE